MAKVIPEIEIVRAEAVRIEEVRPLWRSLSDHHAELTPTGLQIRPSADGWPLRRRRYEESLADGATLFLAQTAEGAVGYALAQPKPAPVNLAIERILEVETVAVLPRERNKGIGTALMEAVGALADEIGLDHLQLAVRASNDGALRLYRRHGFEPLYVTMVTRRGQRVR